MVGGGVPFLADLALGSRSGPSALVVQRRRGGWGEIRRDRPRGTRGLTCRFATLPKGRGCTASRYPPGTADRDDRPHKPVAARHRARVPASVAGFPEPRSAGAESPRTTSFSAGPCACDASLSPIAHDLVSVKPRENGLRPPRCASKWRSVLPKPRLPIQTRLQAPVRKSGVRVATGVTGARARSGSSRSDRLTARLGAGSASAAVPVPTCPGRPANRRGAARPRVRRSRTGGSWAGGAVRSADGRGRAVPPSPGRRAANSGGRTGGRRGSEGRESGRLRSDASGSRRRWRRRHRRDRRCTRP